MNPVPPHPLLSAYLDGELSPNEREEVERLLEHSPEARQELSELEQVGRLLRQLPPQSLPQNFAPQVLDACLSDTGVFEGQTPLPETAIPKVSDAGNRSHRKHSRERNRSWRGLTAVAMAASALGLVVLLSWPTPDETNRDSIAQKNSVPAANADALELPAEAAANTLDMHLAGEANAAKAKNDADFRQEEQREPVKDSGAEAQVQSAMVASTEALTGNVDRKVSASETKELKDLPFAQLAEVMDYQGEQVAVVKLVVTNREQGLKDLKQLLQKRQIAYEPPSEFKKGEGEAAVAGPNGDSNLLAVYVKTSEDQLAFVMQDLQKEAAFQKLTMEAPVETSQIDPYLRSPDANVTGESRNRTMGFGGVGARGVPAPNAIRSSQAMKLEMKAEPPPKPSPEPANPKKMAREKSAANTEAPKPAAPGDPAKAGLKAPDKPAALSRPSEASFGAAGSDTLRETEAPLSQGRRSANEAKPKLGDKETVPETAEPAAVRSMQRELLLSAKQLESLQKQLAPPKDQPRPDVRRKRGMPLSATSGKSVQVLFVLVDRAPNAEAKPQAPAANVPSPTD